MRKVEQFYGTETQSKQAVEVVGLQPGNRKVWVLNRHVHLEGGTYLTPRESPYQWVPAIGLPPLSLECHAKEATMVEGAIALNDLIQALKSVHLQNFPAALMVLGAQMLSIHYESIYSIAGQVPATLAFGRVSLGKTKAAEAAQSLLGLCKNFRVSKITDKQAARLTSMSTLGFLIDDPSSPTEFCEKVLTHFEKGVITSCAASYEPRCTFMATLNMNCLEALADMPKR